MFHDDLPDYLHFVNIRKSFIGPHLNWNILDPTSSTLMPLPISLHKIHMPTHKATFQQPEIHLNTKMITNEVFYSFKVLIICVFDNLAIDTESLIFKGRLCLVEEH